MKYTIITLILIILVIPMFFGIYIEFLLVRELTLFVILIMLFSIFLLFLFGKFIVIYGYDDESLDLMSRHDVIDALINKKNQIVLLIFFPLTMVMEELIFRYYLIGLLYIQLGLDVILVIFISSLVFSLYHIHFWFTFKNLRIVLIYITYSFLLGLLAGYILLTLGIIPCIFVHYALAFYIYHAIYKRHYKNTNY